jgi:hypothetical protein
MIRWHCDIPFSAGATMPEFTTVSVQEAQLRTIPGRQGNFINEYADYIQQLPASQAGRLRIGETENPLTIRRRLITAAKTMNVPLIKRSGNDLYFWREDGEEEQPRRGRPRRGRPGDNFPPQPFAAAEEVHQPEENGHGVSGEDSPELGQTEPVVSDAIRRVDPE